MITDEVNDKKWCVYMHINKINNKKYIGVTSQPVEERWGENGLKYKRNPAFYSAICKYTWDGFEHKIVEDELTEEDAKRMEIDLIALYKTNCRRYKNPKYGYNLTDGGDGMSGCFPSEETRQKLRECRLGTKLSKETREKISKANKGHICTDETRKKLSESKLGAKNYNYGKPLSKEVKKKLSESLSGENNPMYGKSHSEIARNKMSEASQKRWKDPIYKQKMSAQKSEMYAGKNNPKARPIVQLTKDSVFIRYWSFIREAAIHTGINEACIKDCCKGRQKTAGGFKWMYREEYEKMQSHKQRFIILSDVHGFYDEMIIALNEVEFNPNSDVLISLGDYVDRGPKPLETIQYLQSLPRKILVKGNHEQLLLDCINRGYPLSHDIHNGTAQTIADLSPKAKDFKVVCAVAYDKIKDFIDGMVDYFETKNYIFVHSWVPLINKDGLPAYYTRDREFEFNPGWREASTKDFEDARWGNPFALAESGLNQTGKTIVFGHWATEHKWAEVEGRQDFDDKAKFDPYYGDGYIGIDGTTAYSGKVNVLVIEDEFLEGC